MTSQFSHLHVASAYSGHYGVTRPELLAEAAKAMGFEHLAITDRDGLYGAVKHIGACLQLGLKPIVGVDLEVTDEQFAPRGRAVVLAHGRNQGLGWATLCKLVTMAHSDMSAAGDRRTRKSGLKSCPSLTLVQLAETLNASPHCTVLVGAESDFARAAEAGNKNLASSLLGQWVNSLALPGIFGVEIVNHLTEPGKRGSTTLASRLVQLADSVGAATVITNAVRYLTPDDAITADVLDSARFLEPLGAFEPQPNAQAWLKPTDLMAELAIEITGDSSRARALLQTTSKLADVCTLDPPSDCGWGRPKTPEKSALGIEGNPFELLSQKVQDGLEWRYGDANAKRQLEAKHRASKELITIGELGFSTYFLTVADVAQMIRDMKVRSQARGSGAGSLINYLLGVSSVDPIENDLLFERFLSTERSTLPDIDIDVESARRHEIYRAIFKRYGSNRVTLLSMQSTYRGRGAVRDSGMALGFEEEQIDDIAKNVWRFSARSFRSALGAKPELAKIAEAIEQDRRMNLLVDITERLDRLPRYISMHPCGVILGDANLLNLTPTEPSGMGLAMSQFDKDDMDPMGFLKLDVLGVRMQSTMAYAVREIERIHNKKLDLEAIDLADAETFKAINTTNTLGIFQIESPGQRELTGKHQPTKFNDLTIQISLFRPGPMKGNMIAPYLDGRHGFAKAKYLHPDLEPILRETFGVVIFHEHVLRIFNKMTGCTLARADEMRRSLENPRLKPQIEEFFRTASLARGYSTTVVEAVWATIESFSSFGFCKAHGAAFAMPTYQSAWLKTHYPTEFMAGIFTHDPGMYPRRLLLAEARRLGVKILPLDVNRSTHEFVVEKIERVTTLPDETNIGVRMAFDQFYGMSEAEVKRIVKQQPFSDLLDFYERARPSRRSFELLAEVGALDSLAVGNVHTRGDIVARVKQINAAKKRATDTDLQNMLDFAMLDQLPVGNPEPTQAEKVQAELRTLKMDVTAHQMEQYREMLDDLGVVNASDLVGLRSKSSVLVAGVRVATQTPPMRSGKRVVFVTLDDGTGCSDSTFFDEAQSRCSHILFNTRLLVIAGKTRRTGVNGVSLMAENAWDVRELYASWVQARKNAPVEKLNQMTASPSPSMQPEFSAF